MSVLITMKVDVDPKRAEKAVGGNTGRTQKINDEARGLGAIHHSFYGGDGQIMVMDEWDSAASFYKFFETNTGVAEIMHEAGVTNKPDIQVWEKLDTHDEF
jgi:hypothetical protein